MTRRGSGDGTEFLRIYLRDHRAGAAAGVALADRMAGSGAHDAWVAELATELLDTRRRLERIMASIGVRPSRAKDALGRAVELAARLKSNGRWTRRSPLSTLVELETLTGGLAIQLSMWRALMPMAAHLPPEVRQEPARLAERAEGQLRRLREVQEAAATVLVPGASP